jgi:Mg2+-importing ATPase
MVLGLCLPFTPLAPVLGFSGIPARFVGAMALIVLLYILTAEAAKRWFYRESSSPIFHA